MPSKRDAEKAKEESERIVMQTLSQKSPQRWSDLLKNCSLSSRTLKKALNRLAEKGLVIRNVANSEEYPPPVLYGLSIEGKKSSIPLLFSYNVYPYIRGIELKWDIADRKKKQVTVGVIPEKEDLKERIALFGKRLGALQIFAFLKAIEENNPAWVKDAQENLGTEILNLLTFDLEPQKTKFRARVKSIEGRALLPLPSVSVKFTKKQVANLLKLLKEIYPEEIGKFEEILSRIEQEVEDQKKPQAKNA